MLINFLKLLKQDIYDNANTANLFLAHDELRNFLISCYVFFKLLFTLFAY